jgi:hypothetical protein
MWKPVLALLATCALAIAVPMALAAEGDPTPEVTQAAPSYTPPCVPLKRAYAERRWHHARPARGVNVCPSTRRARRRVISHFRLYRHYRRIAPYHCPGGLPGEHYWAKPCAVVACESGYSWGSYNPSGALGPYQLLGWGAPFPVRSFRQRVRHHEIAAGLSISNWDASRSCWG